jgi:hypothetical protein
MRPPIVRLSAWAEVLRRDGGTQHQRAADAVSRILCESQRSTSGLQGDTLSPLMAWAMPACFRGPAGPCPLPVPVGRIGAGCPLVSLVGICRDVVDDGLGTAGRGDP